MICIQTHAVVGQDMGKAINIDYEKEEVKPRALRVHQ